MKAMRIATAGVLGLAILLGLSTLIASAQGPTGTGPVSPLNLDNGHHTIPANSSQWFVFAYAPNTTGTQTGETIRMVLGNKHGLSFDVWSPDAATNWPNAQPVAQGAPYSVDCNTGLPAAQGGCESNDLLWSGTLGSSGNYYVRVNNANPFNVRVLLTGEGQILAVSPQVAVSPQAIPVTGPVLAPASSATILVNVDDPGKSYMIDGQRHTLAPKSAAWYRFDYAISDTGDRPTKEVRLVNGNNSGVSFEVWDGSNLGDWWDNQPIGRGTASQVSCDNGEPAGNTGCSSNDLVWRGQFGATGTYYVRIYNDNLQPTSFDLTIQ